MTKKKKKRENDKKSKKPISDNQKPNKEELFSLGDLTPDEALARLVRTHPTSKDNTK